MDERVCGTLPPLPRPAAGSRYAVAPPRLSVAEESVVVVLDVVADDESAVVSSTHTVALVCGHHEAAMDDESNGTDSGGLHWRVLPVEEGGRRQCRIVSLVHSACLVVAVVEGGTGAVVWSRWTRRWSPFKVVDSKGEALNAIRGIAYSGHGSVVHAWTVLGDCFMHDVRTGQSQRWTVPTQSPVVSLAVGRGAVPAVSDDECASTASVSASSVSASAPARADTTVLIVTADGRLYAHGRNAFGQLGMGDTRDCTDFEEVTALRPLCVQPGVLACGSFHSVFGAALELPGMHVATTYSPCDLYSMGWSRDGQLGREVSGNGIRDQDEASPLIPAPMDVTDDDNDDEALSSISHLSCGSRHTAFIDMRGRLYTCGWNAYGQLGQGRQADGDLQFARVAPPSNGSRFIAVACGAFATVAVILNK